MVMGPGSLGARTVVGPSTPSWEVAAWHLHSTNLTTGREYVLTISTADGVASRNDSEQGTMQLCFSFDYY
jgi:hypothetical protein